MIIGNYEITGQRAINSVAALSLIVAAGIGVERMVDGGPTKHHRAAESSAPVKNPKPTPAEIGCTGLIGKVEVIDPSGKDPAFVRIRSILPSGVKNGQEDCATVYNPNNIAEDLSLVHAGDEFYACREDKPARLEISVPLEDTGYVQGAVNLTGDRKHQMPEGQITDCTDIGWKPNGEIKPPESLLNDTPFYDPKYGESIPAYGQPQKCEDLYGNINWQDPICEAQILN